MLDPTTGILAGLRSGAAYIDMTTNAPSVFRRIAEACRAREVAVLDAPVSGRPPGMTIMACAALTLGGVLDEFPHLRFCFFEAGASWMPYAMYGADRSFEIEPQCARTATRPSQLIRQHCLTAVEPAEHLEQLVEAIGSEQFFFGTDFPHPEFQRYHNTAAAILDRPGLSQEAKDNILGHNIARCLRLG